MSLLSDSKIPTFKYFPTHLMGKEGPKEWAKLWFLQACDRLNIPKELWPTFQGGLRLPAHYGFEYVTKETLPISAFHPLYESEAEWRQRVRNDLEKILDSNALVFKVWFKRELDQGNLTRIKPVRDTSPVELRYEWAARRYCFQAPFKSLETDQYSEGRIKKAVYTILDEPWQAGFFAFYHNAICYHATYRTEI